MESALGERENFVFQFTRNSFENGILLETCNRVEWYSGYGTIPEEIAHHLFRVVSGLDSAIIGETAIVNQVKQAYIEAAKTGTLHKSLHKLFQTALYVGKRVRRETGISKGAMSHGQAAVNLLFQKMGNIKNLNITIIGVNALNEKIIKFLVKKGATTIFIGNRTFEKAEELAEKYDAKALKFDCLPAVLEKTDVLISATSAPHFIIKKENFKSGRKMLMLDLAVPRDVDPLIGELPNVTLFDIETIENQIKGNVKDRTKKVIHAEEIIQKEVQLFFKNQWNGTGKLQLQNN